MSSHHAPAGRTLTDRRGEYGDPHSAERHERRTIVIDDDWDEFDDAPDAWDDEPQARVLWGRVAVLGGALLLAFLVGRVTAPGDEAALDQAEQRISELSADLVQARAELDAAVAGGTTSGAGAAGGDAEAAADGEQQAQQSADEVAAADTAAEEEAASADGDANGATADEAPADAQEAEAADADGAAPDPDTEAPPPMTTHTVEAGDNLFALAERFYGDGREWRRIADANGLAAGAVLTPGQSLDIPPEG